jgi:hypothetical protein
MMKNRIELYSKFERFLALDPESVSDPAWAHRIRNSRFIQVVWL